MTGRRFAASFHDAIAIMDEHGDAMGALRASGANVTPAELAAILPRLHRLSAPDLMAVAWIAGTRARDAAGVPYTPTGEAEFMPD